MNTPTTIEPDHSCPYLDEAIRGIEDARKIHDKLRQWCRAWEKYANYIEEELTKEIEALNEEIERLKEQIDQ